MNPFEKVSNFLKNIMYLLELSALKIFVTLKKVEFCFPWRNLNTFEEKIFFAKEFCKTFWFSKSVGHFWNILTFLVKIWVF